MIAFLSHIDHQLFLFLNGINNPFFDRLMFTASKGLVWLPVYLAFLALVIWKYRWQTLWILLFAALLILVSDQVSNVIKDAVQRLRPSHEPGLEVHLVNAYKGGSFGFYSAHASNSFAVSVFLIILLKPFFRFFFIPVLLWALFLSSTRIYLGVHFPGDILAGMVMGSLVGWGAGILCLRIIHRFRRSGIPGKEK